MRSSAGEHCLHTAGVTGSIPVAPTRLALNYIKSLSSSHSISSARKMCLSAFGGTNCKALRFSTDASRKGVPHVKHSFTRYPDSDVAWQCSGLASQPLLGICSKWHHDHSTHRGHRGSSYGTDLITQRPTRLIAVGLCLMILRT